MTIRRGEDWGEVDVTIEPGTPIFRDEAAATPLVQAAFDRDEPIPAFALRAGDLRRTLGGAERNESDLVRGRGRRFPIDLGVLSFDDGRPPRVFISHVIAHAGRRLWSGRTVTVMNATHAGDLDLGPRAHPNDGLLDITDGRLGRADARRARRRARLGTHLPHPGISERRTAGYEVVSDAALRLWVDGVEVRPTRRFGVECRPDSLSVVI